MKAIFLGIGFFGSCFFAPNANKTIGDEWAIHPFSVFFTLMIVMAAWYLSDSGWLKPQPRTPRRYHHQTRKERTK